jgi:cardiolipin synthase
MAIIASDGIDGYLARRLRQQTILGSVLDPLADKVLAFCVCIALSISGSLPWPLSFLIISRDLWLMYSVVYYRIASLSSSHQPLSNFFKVSTPLYPSLISKVNTTLQGLLFTGLLLDPLCPGLSPYMGQSLSLMMWAVSGTTVWSWYDYYRKHIEALRAIKTERP